MYSQITNKLNSECYCLFYILCFHVVMCTENVQVHLLGLLPQSFCGTSADICDVNGLKGLLEVFINTFIAAPF